MKPRPQLTDMPLHIKEKIVHSTGGESACSLRQCCKEFKMLVDRAPIHYDKLSVRFTNDLGFCVALSLRGSVQCADYLNGAANDNFINAAVNRVMKIVSNRNVSLHQLDLFSRHLHPIYWLHERRRHKFLNLLKARLAELRFKIRVDSLILDFSGDQRHILCVLPHLEPGTLERIQFSSPNSRADPLQLDEVVKMEQWKKAKLINAHNLKVSMPPIENLRHFEYVRFAINTMTLEIVKDTIAHCRRKSNVILFLIHYTKKEEGPEIDTYLNQFDEQPGGDGWRNVNGCGDDLQLKNGNGMFREYLFLKRPSLASHSLPCEFSREFV